MALVAIDLFCGCGGVTRGLRKAGIRVAFGIDVDEDCRLTFALNNPSTAFLAGDLRNLSSVDLLARVPEIRQEDMLLLAACAPCQPFSTQNRSQGRRSDRTVLSKVGQFVRELRPDFLFLENVPGILRVPGFSAFRRFLHALHSLGFAVAFQTVDATWYGVPQTRKRLVLLASLYGPVSWPEPKYGGTPPRRPPITVRQAISKYPELDAGQAHPTIPNHVAARLTARNLERIRATPINGGSRDAWPADLGLQCHDKHDGHQDVYGRLRWDSPAPTLTTKCTSISNGRFGHPNQDRALSVREAAALQGFEDEYVFYGGLREVTKQIGNAVPPILAEQFGHAFIAAFNAPVSSARSKKGWRSLVAKKGTRPAPVEASYPP